MKRILYTAAVICLSLLAAQCTKDIDELQEVEGQKVEIGESYMEMTPGGQIHMYLGISGGSDGATRTTIAEESVEGIRAVSWNEGDKIYVVAPTEGCLGYLTAQNSGVMAAFEGTISSWTGTQTLHYYYVGSNNSIDNGATSYSYSVASQDGTLSGIAANLQLMHASMADMTAGSKKLLSLTMENLMAIGWFDLTTYSEFSKTVDAILTGTYSSATLDLTAGTLSDKNTGDITLGKNLSNSYYIAIIPGSKDMSFKQSSNVIECNASTDVAAGDFRTSGGDPIKVSALPHYFEGTNDYGSGIKIGDVIWAPVNCGVGAGTMYEYPYGKLYQWGRHDGCGYNGGTYTETEIQTALEKILDPKKDYEDPSYFYTVEKLKYGGWMLPYDIKRWDCGDGTQKLTTKVSPTKTGNDPCPMGWRVPTYYEFEALVGRTDPEDKPGSNWTTVTVGGVNQEGGYFTGGVTLSSATSKVFLPAAGERDESYNPNSRGSEGKYWLSTTGVEDSKIIRPFYGRFNSENVDVTGYNYAPKGYSVRCVYDPQIPHYEVSYTITSQSENSAGTDCGVGIKINDEIWSPVNCGYDENLPYGKLYQFGRVAGEDKYNNTWTDGNGAHEAETFTQSSVEVTGLCTSPDDLKFYKSNNTPFDWYCTAVESQLPAWPLKLTDTGYSSCKIANPCPTGWRVPTSTELDNLRGGMTSVNIISDSEGTNGAYFDGTASPSSSTGIFLPAAGNRGHGTGDCYNRGTDGGYWSSDVDGIWGKELNFNSTEARIASYQRAYGFSVRCVLDN